LAAPARRCGIPLRRRPRLLASFKPGRIPMLSISEACLHCIAPCGRAAPQPCGLFSNTVPIPYSRTEAAPRQCFLRSMTLAEAARAARGQGAATRDIAAVGTACRDGSCFAQQNDSATLSVGRESSEVCRHRPPMICVSLELRPFSHSLTSVAEL